MWCTLVCSVIPTKLFESIIRDVETYEQDWTTSGRRKKTKRTLVVQKLAWYTENSIDRVVWGKEARLSFEKSIHLE